MVRGLPAGRLQPRLGLRPARSGHRRFPVVLPAVLRLGRPDQHRARLEIDVLGRPRAVQRRDLPGDVGERADDPVRAAARLPEPDGLPERSRIRSQRHRGQPRRRADGRADDHGGRLVQQGRRSRTRRRSSTTSRATRTSASRSPTSCLLRRGTNTCTTVVSVENVFGEPGTEMANSPPLQFNIRRPVRVGTWATDTRTWAPRSSTRTSRSRRPSTTIASRCRPGPRWTRRSASAKDDWNAELYVVNLTDENTSMFSTAAQFILAEVPMRPRTMGMRFDYRFDGPDRASPGSGPAGRTHRPVFFATVDRPSFPACSPPYSN